MKRFTLLLTATSIFSGLQILAAAGADRFVYPPATKGSQIDNYFGTKVADPYRDLENADAPATRKWIEAENKLTFDYLAAIPERKAINDKLTALWNYEKYSVPSQEGGRYFFTKNTGLQNQSVLYSGPTLPGEAKPLLDPNTLSQDGTVALSGTDVTDDGKLIAYGLAVAGSDWQGSLRRRAMGEIFWRLLEERREWIFLQPLRRAGFSRPTETNKLLSQTLLPQTRDAPDPGSVGL